MAVPRKDVRLTLEEIEHSRLTWCAAKAGVTIAEYVETLIQADTSSQIDAVVDRYHDLVRSGIVGKTAELFGDARKTLK
jgi:hypothetical protein